MEFSSKFNVDNIVWGLNRITLDVTKLKITGFRYNSPFGKKKGYDHIWTYECIGSDSEELNRLYNVSIGVGEFAEEDLYATEEECLEWREKYIEYMNQKALEEDYPESGYTEDYQESGYTEDYQESGTTME